ncbi:MAG: VOC family protein [Cupriavidus sp.]|nr:VOC family protein [Cupriavidus sp.]NUT16015.1 VOC family protein [Cupriavidus sp.]
MTRPANTPWLTPYLTVANGRAALDFYGRAFGFTAGNVVDENGVPTHAEMHYHGQLVVMFAPEGAWGSTARTPRSLGVECPQTFYVYCDDVDAMHQRAVDAGAVSLMAPADQFWGDRYCMVEDPDGYRWGFGKPLAQANQAGRAS